MEDFAAESLDFERDGFGGLELNDAADGIGRTVYDGSVSSSDSSLQFYGVKSLHSAVCGLSGPDGLETSEVVELLAKRATVQGSSSRAGHAGVSYYFTVVLQHWMPDSPSEVFVENEGEGSFIELTFPPEIRILLQEETYVVRILAGATSVEAHARKWKSTGELRITGWEAMAPGRIEFAIEGITNPENPPNGVTTSWNLKMSSCKITFMDKDENVVDSISHGLHIDVYHHSMRFQNEPIGSLVRSKSERCCEYPGIYHSPHFGS